MANTELLNKQYKIPSDILKSIEVSKASTSGGNCLKRANFILKNGALTYQALKRLKNFFDYFNPENDDRIQYALAGGDLMKSFIERTLNANRDTVKRSKETKREMHANVNSELKPHSSLVDLHEEKKNKKFNIENYDKLKKNALAVIANSDNKILLLKRSDFPDQWMPSKWGLVGGAIEKDEEPEDACEREIMEEIGLEIKKFVEKVVIQRNPDSVEHIFACRYTGEPTDITLNKENSNYGWFDVNEMEFLDIVPNLIDYINLVFKSYE